MQCAQVYDTISTVMQPFSIGSPLNCNFSPRQMTGEDFYFVVVIQFLHPNL